MKAFACCCVVFVILSVSSFAQYQYHYKFAPEKWSTPVPVAVLNNVYGSSPFISSDGRKLFFDIGCYIEKTDTGWSEMKLLNDGINRNLINAVSITPDSKKLFFTWWYYEDWDLFYSEWDSVKQDWGTPKWGGPELNDGGEYERYCTFPNDTTIIYLKSRLTHISYFNKRTGRWSQARHWPLQENRFISSYGIHVSPDLKKVYTTRRSPRTASLGESRSDYDICVQYQDSSYTPERGYNYYTPEMLLNITSYSDSMLLAGNLKSTYEGGATLTPDGRTMYFVTLYQNNVSYGNEARIYESHMIVDEKGEPVSVAGGGSKGIKLRPDEYIVMYPPYPNPFNPQTTVRYILSREMKIKSTVYDISGRRVRELKEGTESAGEHSLTIDTNGLPSGIYLIHLQSPYQSLVQKAVVVK